MLGCRAARAGGQPVVSKEAATGAKRWLPIAVRPDLALTAAKRSESSPDLTSIPSTSGPVCVEWEFRIRRCAKNSKRKPAVGVWFVQNGVTIELSMDESGEVSCRCVFQNADSPLPPKTQSGFDPTKWLKVRLEVRQGRLVVAVDNKTIATHTWSDVREEDSSISTNAFARQCDAEFRNIRVHVESSVRADADEVVRALTGIDKHLASGNLIQARKAYKVLAASLGRAPEAKSSFEEIQDRLKVIETIVSDAGLQLDRAESLKLCSYDLRDWSLKGRRLVAMARPPEPSTPGLTTRSSDVDGRELKVWGVMNILFALQAYEVSGLIDRDTSAALSSVQFHWSMAAYDAPHPWIEIQPKQVAMYVGCWKDGAYVKKLITRARLPAGSGSIPFCIRVDKKKAAFFVKDGSTPLLKSDSLPLAGHGLLLMYQHCPDNKRPKFDRLRIGRLPAKTGVVGPVKLPKAGLSSRQKQNKDR